MKSNILRWFGVLFFMAAGAIVAFAATDGAAHGLPAVIVIAGFTLAVSFGVMAGFLAGGGDGK